MKLKTGDRNNLWKRARVTLDGVIQTHCIVADEEAGFILRHKIDSNGRTVFINNHPVTEPAYGKVRIIDPLSLDLAEVYLK